MVQVIGPDLAGTVIKTVSLRRIEMTQNKKRRSDKGFLGMTKLLFVVFAVALTAIACGSPDAPAVVEEPVVADEAETGSNGAVNLTESAIASALWGDHVTITIEDGSFNFVSNGIPNHELPDVYLVPAEGNEPPFGDDDPSEFDVIAPEDLLIDSPIDVNITTNPVYSEEVTENTLGQIGIMISGVQMFNDYEDFEGTIALEDNVTVDGASFIDPCNGHPLANGLNYHYHGLPYCITDNVDVEGEHSTMIGVLLDGFPVYGNKDEAGVTITSADLDECSGHFGPTPEFPEGIYHYHLTDDQAPYSINCFHGEIEYSTERRGGPPGEEGGEGNGAPPGEGGEMREGGGGGPDFAGAAETLGVSESELRDALGGPPPDFDGAAEQLGVSVETLLDALGETNR